MRAFALVPLLVAASISTAAAQVTVLQTFPGINGPNPEPIPGYSSDMMGGVSPTFLVGFINAGFSVRLKTDGSLVQPAQTLEQFWRAAFKNAGSELYGNPYDPKIFYDPLSDRWFATCDSLVAEGPKRGGTKHMLLAVSADGDPTHPWKAVDIEAKVARDIDNLKLGLDRNGVYLTGLVWADDATIPIVAIPKADLLWKGSGVPSIAHVNQFEVPKAPSDPAKGTHGSRGDEGMIPAYDLDPNKKPADPMIFVNRFQATWEGETAIQVRKVTWTSPTTATVSAPITVGLGRTYTEPTTQAMQPPLPQQGLVSPPIRPGGGRLVNAVVSGGSVWAIAATEVNNRTGSFWVQIDAVGHEARAAGDGRRPVPRPRLRVAERRCQSQRRHRHERHIHDDLPVDLRDRPDGLGPAGLASPARQGGRGPLRVRPGQVGPLEGGQRRRLHGLLDDRRRSVRPHAVLELPGGDHQRLPANRDEWREVRDRLGRIPSGRSQVDGDASRALSARSPFPPPQKGSPILCRPAPRPGRIVKAPPARSVTGSSNRTLPGSLRRAPMLRVPTAARTAPCTLATPSSRSVSSPCSSVTVAVVTAPRVAIATCPHPVPVVNRHLKSWRVQPRVEREPGVRRGVVVAGDRREQRPARKRAGVVRPALGLVPRIAPLSVVPVAHALRDRDPLHHHALVDHVGGHLVLDTGPHLIRVSERESGPVAVRPAAQDHALARR